MPKWRDLKRYCENTGWEFYKENNDHFHYRKVLPDGTVLLTKVSMALSKEIHHNMFHMILSRQLKTTKEDFNKNS